MSPVAASPNGSPIAAVLDEVLPCRRGRGQKRSAGARNGGRTARRRLNMEDNEDEEKYKREKRALKLELLRGKVIT